MTGKPRNLRRRQMGAAKSGDAIFILNIMVRPERRVLLASARLVRVSAGAPGSRPQPKAEMPPARAGRQEPLKETGARKRAATSSERCSHVIVSAERCLKGPSRSYHGEGNGFRGSERWHVSREERGTGETLPGSQVRQRPSV